MHSEFEDYYNHAVEAVRGFIGLCHELGGPELAQVAMAARTGLSDTRRAFYANQLAEQALSIRKIKKREASTDVSE